MRSSMTFMVTCPVAKHSHTNDKDSHESSVTLRFAPNCHQMPHLVSTLAVGDVSVVYVSPHLSSYTCYVGSLPASPTTGDYVVSLGTII